MKLLRTIQFDTSDSFVFDRAAVPGEWAVSGAFAFLHRDIPALPAKSRAAFSRRLSGRWFARTVHAGPDCRRDRAGHADVVGLLAAQLVDQFGAPDLASAREAASEEVAFAASLCDHPAGVIVAVTRSVEGGSIREAFRSLRPAAQSPSRAFDFVEIVGAEQEPDEHLDLATLGEGARRVSGKHDFWLACGHHLLDRDDAGRLLVTDEFLKAYLARAELVPPPDACPAERRLHDILLRDPRRAGGGKRHRRDAGIADPDARENWEDDDCLAQSSGRA